MHDRYADQSYSIHKYNFRDFDDILRAIEQFSALLVGASGGGSSTTGRGPIYQNVIDVRINIVV